MNLKQWKQVKIISTMLEILMIWFFFYGIFFVDYHWWWLLVLIFPLGIFLHYSYHPFINSHTNLKRWIGLLFDWMTLFSGLFILSVLFTSGDWWFGFFIPTTLFIIRNIYYGEPEIFNGWTKENIVSLGIISIVFIMMISLFTVPSYVANNHDNQAVDFITEVNNNKQKYRDVQTYSIYDSSGTSFEHVIPKNWYSGNDGNYVNDYVNVIYSNEKANNDRGDLMFGEVFNGEPIIDNGISVGYRTTNYFMPLDDYKGDVSRIVLYMYITYKDNGFPIEKVDLNLMKTWSRLDPVSENERTRNQKILEVYGYSNRLVDNPWLVGFIV